MTTVFLLLITYLSATVLSQCTGNVQQLYKGNQPLLNNSAIIGSRNTEIRCCPESQAVWYHEYVTDQTIVRFNGAILDIGGDITSTNGWGDVYTCSITDGSSVLTQLFISILPFDATIGAPTLSPLTLNVLQSYPLIATLTLNSATFPPTHITWNTTSNCTNSYTTYSHYTNVKYTYTNVLLFNDTSVQQDCYNGLYTVIVSTNNVSYSTRQLELSTPQSLMNVSVSTLNTTHVLISWTPSINTSATYHIYDNGSELMFPHITSSVQYRVYNDTQYSLVLYYTLPNSLPSQTNSLHFQTTSPTQPYNITANAINSTAIQLTWAYDSSILISNFTININNNCSTQQDYSINHAPSKNDNLTIVTITQLQPITEYCFSLISVNSWGNSEETELLVCAVTQFGASNPLSAPFNITYTNLKCNVTRLSWQPIPCNERNGPLNYYSLNILNKTCTGPVLENVTSLEPSLNISFIRPFTDYCVRIATVNIGERFGPYSTGTRVKSSECPPGKIETIRLIKATLTTAQVTWSAPYQSNGIITEYLITYNQNNTLTSMLVSNSSVIIMITDLIPGTLYIFTVQAINSAGIGQTTYANVSTMSIESIRVQAINWTSNGRVILKWNKPLSDEINTIIISYTVNNERAKMIALSNNVTNWTRDLSIKDSQYSFSIAAAVSVNGSLFIGPYTVLRGCYGECTSDDIIQYIIVGGATGGALVVFILFIIIITCIIIKYQRRKADRTAHRPLFPLTTVKEGKAPTINAPIEDINTKSGDDVIITLDISGQPFPDVTWFFDNQIIADDEHFELEEETQLMIHNIQSHHSGVYHFTVSNALGSVEGQVRVFVPNDHIAEDIDSPFPLRTLSSTDINGNKVALNMWADHVECMSEEHGKGFKNEFQRLTSFNYLSTEIGNKSENKRRNRFKTVLPYDDNIVELQPIESRGDCSHSYINASYIDGYRKKKQFIATQGPLPQTLVDFWRLVWQEDSCCILMLLSPISESGIVRCQQYWPDYLGTVAYYGPFKVTVETCEENDIFTERRISIMMTSDSTVSKTIHHYQYNCWPEHGLPDTISPLLKFYDEVKMWLDIPSPLIVHCSAGIGPTAVFLAIILGLEQGQIEGSIDTMATINKFRRQRMNMVQTEDQYQFIHKVLLESFYTIGKESITGGNLQLIYNRLDMIDETLQMTGYQAHYKALQVLSPKPNNVPRNVALSRPKLSRSNLFLPPDKFRVILQGKNEDYIHASYLDGYKQPKALIIAESPTKATAVHFWSMVVEQKCGVIVMLCDCIEQGMETCFQYWPASAESERHFSYYRIKHKQQTIRNDFIKTTFIVKDTQIEEEYTVVQIQLPNWTTPADVTDSHSQGAITAVINEVESIQRNACDGGNRPVIVHCSDTVSRSGIFCTLYTAIQQMKVEQQVNIYRIVANMRAQKPGLLSTPEQYKMVYSLLLYFINEYDTYGNFEQKLHKSESIYNI